MSSFIFVRHGKSQANNDKVIGNPNSPLTKEGQAQARKVGRDLKKEGITAIIASPLLRARETADIIAKQLKFTGEIQVIDDLRERGFGQLIDRPKEHPSLWYFTVDGESDVEPKGVLIARCEAALAKIKKLAETEKVLVVGHAVSGFYLKQVAAGKRLFDDFDDPVQLNNSGHTVVTIADKIPMQRTSREANWSLLAIIIGVICLIAGIWLFNQEQAATPVKQVKQSEIPLNPEDYNGDPNLQGAVQRQLQQQQETGQSTNDTSKLLQPVTTGVPNDWQ